VNWTLNLAQIHQLLRRNTLQCGTSSCFLYSIRPYQSQALTFLPSATRSTSNTTHVSSSRFFLSIYVQDDFVIRLTKTINIRQVTKYKYGLFIENQDSMDVQPFIQKEIKMKKGSDYFNLPSSKFHIIFINYLSNPKGRFYYNHWSRGQRILAIWLVKNKSLFFRPSH
jgi:hypothetical protein